MSAHLKRLQAVLIALIITIGALYFALQGVDFQKLRLVIAEGHYFWLVPAAICSLLPSVVRALRWKSLLNSRISLRHSFHILNANYLFNSLLPMRLGEVVRAFMTTRLEPPLPMITSLSTVVVKRLMDLLSIVLIAILALMISPVRQQIAFAAQTSGGLGISGISLFIFFVVRPDIARRVLQCMLKVVPTSQCFSIETAAEEVLEGIAPLGFLKTGLPIIIWTLCAWFTSILQVYLLLFVFYDAPIVQVALLITVLSALTVALPAIPGNVVPYKAALVFALNLSKLAGSVSLERPRAFSLAVLFQLNSVLSFIGVAWSGSTAYFSFRTTSGFETIGILPD